VFWQLERQLPVEKSEPTTRNLQADEPPAPASYALMPSGRQFIVFCVAGAMVYRFNNPLAHARGSEP
jgi:hypothetical protein